MRTAEKTALAFAVGSSVYFWFQFRALASFEDQVNQAIQPIAATLQSVGISTAMQPTNEVTTMQQQAPAMALAAAAATFLLA